MGNIGWSAYDFDHQQFTADLHTDMIVAAPGQEECMPFDTDHMLYPSRLQTLLLGLEYRAEAPNRSKMLKSSRYGCRDFFFPTTNFSFRNQHPHIQLPLYEYRIRSSLCFIGLYIPPRYGALRHVIIRVSHTEAPLTHTHAGTPPTRTAASPIPIIRGATTHNPGHYTHTHTHTRGPYGGKSHMGWLDKYMLAMQRSLSSYTQKSRSSSLLIRGSRIWGTPYVT